MVKDILWLLFFISLFAIFFGESHDKSAQIVFLSSLIGLSICESIEKRRS